MDRVLQLFNVITLLSQNYIPIHLQLILTLAYSYHLLMAFPSQIVHWHSYFHITILILRSYSVVNSQWSFCLLQHISDKMEPYAEQYLGINILKLTRQGPIQFQHSFNAIMVYLHIHIFDNLAKAHYTFCKYFHLSCLQNGGRNNAVLPRALATRAEYIQSIYLVHPWVRCVIGRWGICPRSKTRKTQISYYISYKLVTHPFGYRRNNHPCSSGKLCLGNFYILSFLSALRSPRIAW